MSTTLFQRHSKGRLENRTHPGRQRGLRRHAKGPGSAPIRGGSSSSARIIRRYAIGDHYLGFGHSDRTAAGDEDASSRLCPPAATASSTGGGRAPAVADRPGMWSQLVRVEGLHNGDPPSCNPCSRPSSDHYRLDDPRPLVLAHWEPGRGGRVAEREARVLVARRPVGMSEQIVASPIGVPAYMRAERARSTP